MQQPLDAAARARALHRDSILRACVCRGPRAGTGRVYVGGGADARRPHIGPRRGHSRTPATPFGSLRSVFTSHGRYRTLDLLVLASVAAAALARDLPAAVLSDGGGMLCKV
eukprot:332744-Chlamydomonas_euryale.AAC.2